MPSESRGAVNGNNTAPSVGTQSFPAPGPQSYLLIAVAISNTALTVTGIIATSGTFTQVAAINSATRRLELWVGYNFGTAGPTVLTITRSAGTANMAYAVRVVDVLGDASTAPSTAASTGTTATSASADSGAVTPAVGDLLFAACVLASTTADSTARTHTGNTYRDNTAAELTNIRVECGWGEAIAAVPSSEAWTLGAAVEWAAIQARVRPSAPPAPSSAFLIKGLTTQALDASSPR